MVSEGVSFEFKDYNFYDYYTAKTDVTAYNSGYDEPFDAEALYTYY